jgi:hypothetical protein
MPITPMFHVHAWGYPYIATMLGVKHSFLALDPFVTKDLLAFS